MTLTALTIKNLKNQDGKPYTDYLDANGLKVRVTRTGHKSYIYRYKMNGKPYEYTLGACDDLTLADARKQHAALNALVKAGTNPKIERDLNAKTITAIPTVSEFATTFIERYAKPKNKAWQEQERILKADVSIIGTLKINAVERKHIIKLLDKKEDAGAPVARNRLLSLLSKYFGFALERGLIEVNPATGIKKLPEQTRDRTLTADEIRQLWTATSEDSNFNPSTRLVLRLALLTGQRIGELCRMSENQLNGNLWTIPTTKNGLPHTVPLCAMALELIEATKPYRVNGLLFPNTKGGVMESQVISKVMERIAWDSAPDTDRPTPHDLRRTFTTGISKLGFNRLVQDKVTNHKDNSVGGIYDRNDYQKEKRQALEAWERHIQEILTGEPMSNVIAFKTA